VIEEVEEFGAEVETHTFARQCELLDYGEVGVDEIRPDDRDARGIAQLAGGRGNKAGCVDPLQVGVVRVVGIATRRPGRRLAALHSALLNHFNGPLGGLYSALSPEPRLDEAV
jgi:hypothetical protein